MKKLLSIIFVFLLLSGNVYAESSWFEIKNKNNNTSYHFNLKKVEEISPNKFKIQSVTIKTPKRLKYEEFLIKNLVPYCGKPKGDYKEPAEFLTNGKPTTSMRALQYIPGMEEILWNEYKAGKSKQPAGMSLEEFEFATYGNFISKGKRGVYYFSPYREFSGTVPIFCTTKIENQWKDDYSKTNEKLVIAENIRNNSEEKVTPDYYDCRNRKIGIDLSGEPFWTPQPVRKNTYGELRLNKVCEKLDK
jgi:hypothetical protein